MEVKSGATVFGTDGKLGQVTSVTYDVHTHTVDDLVVRHGVLLSKQYMVPLRHLVRADGDNVYTDLDLKAFEALDEFADYPNRLRDSNPRDSADLAPEGPQAFGLGMGTYVGDPLPETRLPQTQQGEPDVIPEDERVPVIRHGTPVYDAAGEHLGEVEHFSVDTDSEQLSALRMKRGLLGGGAMLSREWIRDVNVKGIELNVTKSEIQ